ncbi:MAG: DUF433 domain-containing protein [Verrucomicrobia subdivision 3 bacterium]|nr:DUF433 domain-containing protein [Limisphaerales bacterium]
MPLSSDYKERIAIEPGKRSGRPCVRGGRTRLANCMSHTVRLSDFPELTEEDLRACLAHAAERKQAMCFGNRTQRT